MLGLTERILLVVVCEVLLCEVENPELMPVLQECVLGRAREIWSHSVGRARDGCGGVSLAAVSGVRAR